MPDHGWIRGATDGSNKFTTLWHAETFEGLEARKARGDTLQKLWKNWTFEQVWERIKKADIRQTLEWYLN
jgi:hypothetical protein